MDPLTASGARRPGGAQVIPRPPDWRSGSTHPWPELTHLSVADVVAAIPREPSAQRPAMVDARPSAVLVVLAEGPYGAEVLLTRRSWELRHHKGEVSFPGGRMDDGEHPIDAALREAWEEVGLDPSLVVVHGELDHINTFVSQSYIVPVVATVAQHPELSAQTMEVDRIMWVPLVELVRRDTYREEFWTINGVERMLLFYELDDETVWGATGRMLGQLLALATGVPSPLPPGELF